MTGERHFPVQPPSARIEIAAKSGPTNALRGSIKVKPDFDVLKPFSIRDPVIVIE
jgi:hypothetical protein